jgi:hypothetical protein
MLEYIVDRAREPSTYAGFAGLAAAAGMTNDQWQAVAAVVMAIAGVFAVFINEKGPEA